MSIRRILNTSFFQVVNAAVQAMNDELPRLQEGVYYGQINIRTDILEKFLTEEGQPRYNPQVEYNQMALNYLCGLHFS